MSKNENFFATDFHGFTRIGQRQALRAHAFSEILRERRGRLAHTPAAERRHLLAQDVSPGCAARNGTESRRDDTELDPRRNDPPPRITNLRWATTAQTLASDPPHSTAWNERRPSCI